MPRELPTNVNTLVVRPEQPLIGVILRQNGHQVVRYFTEESEADAALAKVDARHNVRHLAGAWSDLDWDDMVSALDRIRHGTTPTPPITEL